MNIQDDGVIRIIFENIRQFTDLFYRTIKTNSRKNLAGLALLLVNLETECKRLKVAPPTCFSLSGKYSYVLYYADSLQDRQSWPQSGKYKILSLRFPSSKRLFYGTLQAPISSKLMKRGSLIKTKKKSSSKFC